MLFNLYICHPLQYANKSHIQKSLLSGAGTIAYCERYVRRSIIASNERAHNMVFILLDMVVSRWRLPRTLRFLQHVVKLACCFYAPINCFRSLIHDAVVQTEPCIQEYQMHFHRRPEHETAYSWAHTLFTHSFFAAWARKHRGFASLFAYVVCKWGREKIPSL